MTKELELLGKMDLTEENRAKLQALLEESKKTGKVASKKLVETLDAVDATEEQTEKFYDVLEAAGVEIDVSDVPDLRRGDHHRRADARRRFHRLPELRRRAGVRSGRGRGRAEGITPCNPKTV